MAEERGTSERLDELLVAIGELIREFRRNRSESLSLTVPHALAYLSRNGVGIGRTKLNQLIADDVFSVVRSGVGRGSTRYLKVAELDAFIAGGVPAVRELRAEPERGANR